jgi:hypothetical protein
VNLGNLELQLLKGLDPFGQLTIFQDRGLLTSRRVEDDVCDSTERSDVIVRTSEINASVLAVISLNSLIWFVEFSTLVDKRVKIANDSATLANTVSRFSEASELNCCGRVWSKRLYSLISYTSII